MSNDRICRKSYRFVEYVPIKKTGCLIKLPRNA